MMAAMDSPTISCGVAEELLALAFHERIVLFRSLPTMASSDDSTIAASRARLVDLLP
jgi:hypothetical protein